MIFKYLSSQVAFLFIRMRSRRLAKTPRPLKYLLVASLMLCLLGCQTTSQGKNSKEDTKNVEKILSAIVGALSGKPLTEEELHSLKKQIQTDEEVQSAVQAIADSVGGKATQVKYCPVTGRRYASYFEICPEHQVKLEVVSP